MKRLPARWFPWTVAAIMGSVMTGVVAAVVTAFTVDDFDAFLHSWPRSWFIAALVAIPLIGWLAPRVRRLATRIAVPPD